MIRMGCSVTIGISQSLFVNHHCHHPEIGFSNHTQKLVIKLRSFCVITQTGERPACIQNVLPMQDDRFIWVMR